MAAFRFRATAALDVRRQQEEAAAAVLARAEAEFAEAKRVLGAEEATAASAGQALVARMAAGSDVETLTWHRNWIVGCRASVDRARRDVDGRRLAARAAEAAWQQARSRRLALERMRERAWRRFRYDEQRQDAKAMDEVARLRHVLGTRGDTW